MAADSDVENLLLNFFGLSHGESNLYFFDKFCIFNESVDTNISTNNLLIFFLFNVSNVQEIRGFPFRFNKFLFFNL